MKQSHLPVIAVIPAHNNAKTLPPLLDELIQQKYDDIYVIDDASTDDTVKIIKSYGSKVKLIENDENVGSGANRNRIIGRTDKAIIHFIDADMPTCGCYPKTLQRLYAQLNGLRARRLSVVWSETRTGRKILSIMVPALTFSPHL